MIGREPARQFSGVLTARAELSACGLDARIRAAARPQADAMPGVFIPVFATCLMDHKPVSPNRRVAAEACHSARDGPGAAISS